MRLQGGELLGAVGRGVDGRGQQLVGCDERRERAVGPRWDGPIHTTYNPSGMCAEAQRGTSAVYEVGEVVSESTFPTTEDALTGTGRLRRKAQQNKAGTILADISASPAAHEAACRAITKQYFEACMLRAA